MRKEYGRHLSYPCEHGRARAECVECGGSPSAWISPGPGQYPPPENFGRRRATGAEVLGNFDLDCPSSAIDVDLEYFL